MEKLQIKGKRAERTLSQDKERSIFSGLILGVAGIALEGLAVWVSNSLTVGSDLLKNVGLVTAVFFAYLSIRKVNRGKTEGYNYGYGKLESFSGLIVAVVLVIALIIVINHIIERIQHPVDLHTTGLDKAIILCAVVLLISISRWRHDYHLSKKEYSPIMESLWRMYRFKTISMGFVILSLTVNLIFDNTGWDDYVDPICSIVVGLFIVHAIYSISTMSVYDLLDRTLEESLQLVILRELAKYFDEYEAIHGIRSRRSGANVYVEIFLEFDGQRKMAEVQAVIDAIKNELEQKIHGSQIVISPATSHVV